MATQDRPGRHTGLIAILVLLLLGLLVAGFLLVPRLFESPPDQVQVPNLIRLNDDQARAAIREAGLTVGDVSFAENDNVAAGKVAEQQPNRDQYVDPGTSVDIVVSLGEPQIAVPPIVGLSREDAAAQLRNAGLRASPQETQSDQPAGQVVATDPAVGTEVGQGATVTIAYSDGPEAVPELVGRSRQEAERLIGAAGFRASVVRSSDTTEPAGTVIQQSPGPGETLPEGSTVTIVVSTYEPTEEPSPTETVTPSETAEPTEEPTEEPSAFPTDLEGRTGEDPEAESGRRRGQARGSA